MNVRFYCLAIMCISSLRLFAAAQCEERRPLPPIRPFNDAEYTVRLQWYQAYESFTAHGSPPKNFQLAMKSAAARIRKNFIRLNPTVVNPKGLRAASRQLFKEIAVQLYEQGQICTGDEWIKPARFFAMFVRARELEMALEKHGSVTEKVGEYAQALEDYKREHEQAKPEVVLNQNTEDQDRHSREQAALQKRGVAPFTMFSIKNFADEAKFIALHFENKRQELGSAPMQRENLTKAFSARQKRLKQLQGDLRKFLRTRSLLIELDEEPDLRLMYQLEKFRGDIESVIKLNEILRDITLSHKQIVDYLSSLPSLVFRANRHFSEMNAELCAQEKLEHYAVSLDAMIIAMRKLWRTRIKDGYASTLDNLLGEREAHEQFFLVEALLKAKSSDEPIECIFCCSEGVPFQICENAKHVCCADCLKSNWVIRLSEGKGNVTCLYQGCTSTLCNLDYPRLLQEQVFPFEFFEAFKSLWLRRNELDPHLLRCHLNCCYFHEVPHDKIPGQSSPPCPDCHTQTCFSCKNMAHQGSKECRAPDAEAMKAAHKVMFDAGFRACPSCGVWGKRESGCDAIPCEMCGQTFSNTDGRPWQQEHVQRFGYHAGDVREPTRLNNDL